MKTNYFTKVENKYVFNVSLIFWHIFIAIATLTIVISFGTFLWTAIPASKKEVEKPAYPLKKQYPEPAKVALNELRLEEVKHEEAPQEALEPVQTTTTTKETTQPVVEDTKGKKEYENSLNTLKTLIPPSKYSWQGAGYWSYPYGERYWTFYKQEKYRQWVSTEPGLEEKLIKSYKTTNAGNYSDKKQILDGYISIIKLLPEDKRSGVLLDLIRNVAGNVSQNINIHQSLAKLVSKMAKEENILYIAQLARFGKTNPKDGSPFIDYTTTIIDKFALAQRSKIIEDLINSYYNYFNQNIVNQKEATDLFLPMVSQIKGNLQHKAIIQYYGLYLEKNRERDNVIAQIETEHSQQINSIDQEFENNQRNAEINYQNKMNEKENLRYKSLEGMAGGIILIVLIASALVFLSIQRSVRKIEEKISSQNNS